MIKIKIGTKLNEFVSVEIIIDTSSINIIQQRQMYEYVDCLSI
jgi:hypothetical protein